MSQITCTLWNELTATQQQQVEVTFGSLAHWLRIARLRASSIAVAWERDLPCGVSVISHDRVRIGAALVDVATLRHSDKVTGQSDELSVEMLMYQAQSLLSEGIGIVLVHGDVEFWSQFGFAPMSLTVETRWHQPIQRIVTEPGTVYVAPLSDEIHALVRSMQMAIAGEQVAFVDIAVPDLNSWLHVIGRDGQLRAAAQLKQNANYIEVVRAAASDDGAALDLVQALLEHVPDASQLVIRLPVAHAVTRMAQELHATTTVTSSANVAIMAGVIDLPLMLEALKPAFRQRILTSPYAEWCGGVRVEISDERAMIMFDNGAVSVIDGTREASLRLKHVDVAALPQMAFGYRSISALRRAGMLYCDDTELALCEAIFATTSPMLVV
ncbi:MAG: hypothetical protein ACO3F2_04300 [Roseiflexaceae bacterium]